MSPKHATAEDKPAEQDELTTAPIAWVSTHSGRKTFAARVYSATGKDLIATQRLMGHRSPLTTARYLETNLVHLDSVVLAINA